MRIEEHFTHFKNVWHCHLYMSENELKNQPIRHITKASQIDKIVGLNDALKAILTKLFNDGLQYVEIFREEYNL